MGNVERRGPFVFSSALEKEISDLSYAEPLVSQRVNIISLEFRNQNGIFGKIFAHTRELFNYSWCIR